MKTTTELIEEKGLTVDCFDELDEVIILMESNLEKFRVLAEKSTEKLLPHVIWDSSLPFHSWDVEKYEDHIKEVRRNFEDKIRWVINAKFNSIEFDSDDYKDFLKTQEKFDARAIMFYFFEKYGESEDEIRIMQIQEKIINSLPNRKIVHSSKKGIKFEFDTNWNDRVHDYPPMKQLADIIFEKIKPTEARGFAVEIYAGSAYHGRNFDVMKFNKKGTGTFTLDTEEDCKAFSEAIFADPKELLSRMEA